MNRRRKTAAAAILMIMTIAAGHAQTAVGAPSINTGMSETAPGTISAVETQAALFAQALAKENAFAEWTDAKMTVEPLGPGTHSWLAVLVRDDREIGYMVISAVPDGSYRLVEYGAGPYRLFGAAALKAAAQRYGFVPAHASRRYAGPFLAVWRARRTDGEILYLDALTGDKIETLNDMLWKIASKSANAPGKDTPKRRVTNDVYPGSPTSVYKISHSITIAEFDPYARMPWLTRQPLRIRSYEQELQPLLKQGKQLRLTATPFGDTYLAVWAVAGSHEWRDGTVMIAVHQDGLRFIALDQVLRYGQLYT